MAMVKYIERPAPGARVELRDGAKAVRDSMPSFWKRPADDPKPKVQLIQAKEPERRRMVEFGDERLRCRHHGANKPPRVRPGKGRSLGKGQINNSIVLRNSMIKAGLIPVVVIKRVDRAAQIAAMPIAGTLTLVR